MNYQLDQYRALFDKAYKEAIDANYRGNYALAQVRFLEAAKAARKLAVLDAVNKVQYLERADKMERIAQSLAKKVPKPQEKGYAPAAAGSAPEQRGGAGDAYRGEADQADDMSAYYTFYAADQLNEGFESVIGLDEAKAAVTEYVINPIKYPEAYNYRFMNSKCILLEGPPGTGKTTFAKAVAKEIEQPFALVNVAALVNCYVGETGKTIDRVFDSLRRFVDENQCGVTVFFDEFDEIAKSRSGDDKASQTAVPALLRNLDGIKENNNFLVIANTNCVDMLDAGVLSRFRRKIYIPLPDKDMRKHFFAQKLAQLEPEYFNQLDLDALADEAEGLSGRDITQICDDFLHHVGGIKAQLRTSEDLNADFIAIIRNR
jgi:Cdc6-like AAA superfamily ATPase